MDTEPDPAEQAFEMLRAEVAAMRKELRQLAAATARKRGPKDKHSLKVRRKSAAWDTAYLEALLR